MAITTRSSIKVNPCRRRVVRSDPGLKSMEIMFIIELVRSRQSTRLRRNSPNFAPASGRNTQVALKRLDWHLHCRKACPDRQSGTVVGRPTRPIRVRPGWRRACGIEIPRYVRLRAHLNSRVRVPDLADTVEPVTESNCAEAITSGGKQLKVNNQSVTASSWNGGECELDSVGVSDEPAYQWRSPNEIVLLAQREWTRPAEIRRCLEMEWLEVRVT